MPNTKPSCGCCSDDFEIVSVKHKAGSVYEGQFNGCNVNPIVWVARKGCVDFAAGDAVPRPGGFFDMDLDGVPDDNYEIFASSPNCTGFGRLPDGKTFAVTHNSGIVPDEEDEEPLATPSITATGINSNTIRINWAHPGGADEFQLQYLVGDSWANVDGGVFSGTLREANTTPWASNTQFSFRLRAKKDAAYSDWSNVATATAADETTTDGENPNDPPVTPNLNMDFVFLTNTTGYFDSSDFVGKITGLRTACRVVRWCIRWDEYETSPGVYRTDKLAARKAQIDAIYAAAGQPAPYYAINFWGVRHDDKIEQFIPARDVVKFQSGKRATGGLVIGKSYGLGSFSSTAYRKRMADCAYSIVNWGKENAPGRLYYAAYSNGQTEERYNYLWDNPDSPYIYESHGDFSDVAVDAFRIYCIHRFGTTTPWGEASASATMPTAPWDTYHEPWVVSGMMGSAKGQAWTDFTNEEMEKTVIAFRNGCKSADNSVAVIDFIADFFRIQANGWLANSISTYRLTAQLDGLYHSDGDTADDDDYAKKYSSFDTMVPTWGADKLYFCELDYKDMYMYGTGLPSKDAIKRTTRAVYRKGGKGVHFAMSMTQAQAEVAAEACLEILAEIEAGTLVRLDRSSAPNFTYNLRPACYGGGDNLLNYYKSTAGGTETNVVNLKLIDNS
ncbi:fibronectin type III domain-containing protein [Runella sp.]|uniref:fibronectin type III domain-containing protein n=1 Tax=Runella sp. TaxID=1960881 RepID=UPI00301A6518